MRNIGKEIKDKMLTIENLKKIEGKLVVDDWYVREVAVLTHNDCYFFGLHNVKSFGITDRCTIMLERNAITQRSSTRVFGFPFEKAYFFICDYERTNTCGTADWLADMDNILKVFADLIKSCHTKL